MTGALIRRGASGHLHREDTGRRHVEMEGRTGVIHLQSKDHQGLLATPEAKRGKKVFCPRTVRGSPARLTP